MPWCTNYSRRLNESQLFESEQKSEFLSALRDCEIRYNCENSPDSDPNLAMDVRHSMVRANGTFNFMIPAKEQIQTFAFKQLREENHQKLLDKKNHKLVEAEICKLKKLLNTYQTVREINKNKMYIEKFKAVRQKKFSKHFIELKNNSSLHYLSEINQKMNETLDFNLKNNENEFEEESTLSVSNRKGSLVEEILSEGENSWQCESEQNGKEKLLNDFFENLNPVHFENENLNSKGSVKDFSPPDEVVCKKSTSETDCQVNDTCVKKTESLYNSFQDKVSFCEKNTTETDCQVIDTCVQNTKERLDKGENILIKVWQAWRIHTLNCRRRKIEKTTYENKIKNFIARLRELKIKNNIEKEQNVPNSLEKNKPLIAKQKFKKELILSKEKLKQKNVAEIKNSDDIKLNEIQKELKASQIDAKARLAAIRMKKEKEKLLENKQEVIYEKRKIYPNPNFLIRMEKRKEEREIRKKEILEKKQKLEEERKKILAQVEEEKKMLEEEEKRQKRLEIKQKKEEDERKRELLKLQIIQAKRHYEKALLRNYGLARWASFVKDIQLQEQDAENVAKNKLLLKVFKQWHSIVEETIREKEKKALEFNRMLYLKKYLIIWKNVWSEGNQKYQAAADFHDFRITDKFFNKWLQITHFSYVVFLNKSRIAQSHYEKKLKKRFLQTWKAYPAYKKQEIAREMRKQVWRQKIQQILPDYQPIDITTDSSFLKL